MAKKPSRSLELTVISGESLSLAGKQPLKKNSFVVIKTDPNKSDHQATTMDTEHGSYPSWNEKFFIDMPMHVNFITLEVHCKKLSGDHLVGSARVPVSDFTGWCFPVNYLHFLSYRLRDRIGERNGIINLSIRVKSSPDNVYGYASTSSATAAAAYSSPSAAVGQKVSDGVAIGIPVRQRY